MPTNLKEFNQRTFAEEPNIEDTNIACIDCGKDFVWTVGEQLFFRDKGLQNPPKRCKECKQAKNNRLNAILQANETGIKQKIEVAVTAPNATATRPFLFTRRKVVQFSVAPAFWKRIRYQKTGRIIDKKVKFLFAFFHQNRLNFFAFSLSTFILFIHQRERSGAVPGRFQPGAEFRA